ncbi:MAG: hypothetical protein V3575_06520 [Candidatus Absconditabacteria bacterium]
MSSIDNLKRIDQNNDGLIDEAEAKQMFHTIRGFSDEEKIEFGYEMDNDEGFKNVIKDLFLDNLYDIKLSLLDGSSLDSRSIKILQGYGVLFFGKTREEMGMIERNITPEIQNIFQEILKTIEINEESKIVDSITIKGNEFSFINPENGMIEIYSIDGLPAVQEIQDKLRHQERKEGQLKLLVDVGTMYRDYLQSILNNISFGFLSQKDERYNSQIQVITSEIQSISAVIDKIQGIKMSDIDLKESTDLIFKSEEDIAQTYEFDEPIYFTSRGLLNNTLDSIAQTNQTYKTIKDIIINGYGKEDDFDSNSILDKKLKIFKLIRGNDGFDDNKHKYDTGIGIQRGLENDILLDKGLNNKSSIKETFENIINIKTNTESQKEFFKSFFDGKLVFFDYLDKNGFDSKEVGEELYDLINETQEQIKKQIESLIESGELKFENEEDKKKKIDEIIIGANVTALSRFMVHKTLDKNQDYVKELGKESELVDLYSKVEGVGDYLSDVDYNSRVETMKFWASQIAIMYVAGLSQLGTRMVVGNSLRIEGATTGTASMTTAQYLGSKAFLTKLGTEATLLGTEGAAFYKVYDILNGLMNSEDVSKLLVRFNVQDWYRTTMFLGVLRAIPPLHYAKVDKMNFGNKVTTDFLKGLGNITLDTAELLGTDIVIKLSFQEGVPNPISNMGDFFDFICEELKFIIPLVIGLRGAENTLGGVAMLEKFEKNLNKDIIVVVNKDGQISIEGLKIDIRRLKQSIDILNKQKQTNKVVNDKQKLRGELQTTKQEYKEQRESSKQSESDIHKAEGYKPKSNDGVKEDLSWSVVYKELGIDLNNIKLEDVIKGFNIKDNVYKGEGISTGFKKLLDRFEGNRSVDDIGKDVGEVVDLEFTKLKDYLDSLEGLTPRQLEQIELFKENIKQVEKRITADFMKSLESRIKSQELNKDYGENIRWLTDVIDSYVKNMDSKLKEGIKNGDIPFVSVPIKK